MVLQTARNLTRSKENFSCYYLVFWEREIVSDRSRCRTLLASGPFYFPHIPRNLANQKKREHYYVLNARNDSDCYLLLLLLYRLHDIIIPVSYVPANVRMNVESVRLLMGWGRRRGEVLFCHGPYYPLLRKRVCSWDIILGYIGRRMAVKIQSFYWSTRNQFSNCYYAFSRS